MMVASGYPPSMADGVCDRVGTLVELCRNKHVLHLGCADWPYTERRIAGGELLHQHLSDVCSSLVGVDLCAEGLAMLRGANPRWDLRTADASTFEPDFQVEVIVASELIEHLENPGSLLRGIRRWATPPMRLVITTPNAYSLKGALRGLMRDEYCHPDHAVVFSTKTLIQLLKRTGWSPEALGYYHVPGQSAASKLPAGVVRILATLVSPRIGDGIIAVAQVAP